MSCTALLPAEIPAGLDFQASLELADYPAPDWAVTAYLRGPVAIDLAAVPDGKAHKLAAAASTTAGWAPGAYWYTVRATKAGKVVELSKGQLAILPDLATVAGPYDGRSQNEIALAAIDAVLAKRATIDQQRYTIGQRELWRTPIPELLKLKSFYTMQVRRERKKASGCTGFGKAIQVRFSNQ